MDIYESGAVIDSLTKEISFTTISLKKKVFTDNTSSNYIEVMYVGQSWTFYEMVQIKIDDNLYNLTDGSASRTQAQGFCIEILRPALSQEMINGIKNCKALVIQINGKSRGKPIAIDPNGMKDVNRFYNES